MSNLTDQQKQALDLQRHISVTANAGSGKTRVLVERFVAAVKSGVDVARVLCLTFTEKAALELRDKIAARLNSELLDASRENRKIDEVRSLREARRKLLEANISTIHSFCSQVLREFPVEAGVDANFKVLESFDSSALKEDSCSEAIREAVAEEHIGMSERSNPRKVHDLLVRIGYTKALRLLVELTDNREKIEHIRLHNGTPSVHRDRIKEHWSLLAKSVVRVLSENVKPKKDSFEDELVSLKGSIHEGNVDLNPLLVSLRTLLPKILTKQGTPRKRAVSIEDGPTYTQERAGEILGLAFTSSGCMDEGPDLLDAETYVLMSNSLEDLYERSNLLYSRKKYLIGALDFDDLQIFTMHLLKENGAVRASLAARFDHIMVDEFQDTNFLQYDIFQTLLRGMEEGAKLFVVGDPKQSIYRFRNAQVEVSLKVDEDLSHNPDGAHVSLLETFRMNAGLAAFVNEVFQNVMNGTRVAALAGLPSVGEMKYDRLLANRPPGQGSVVEVYIKEKTHHGEDNEEQDGETSESEPTNVESQSQFVAARIRQMIDTGETIRTAGSGEQPRSITFGDVAVLLRSRTRLPDLERFLTEYNIPYNVSAGIGFYSAQEIYDLTSYLTFLLDNTSDIDLLTILRSPFFGISENELYRIARAKGESFFDKLQNESLQSESEEVQYASAVLSSETQLSHKLTIPQLLNRILERTGWLAAHRQSPTADQRLANLRKLLGIAREFESRGFNSLYDFVERLKYLADAAREGQAMVEEESNSVKIMTVHAAKGLEFPVVVVPFCDAKSRAHAQLIVNDQVGILPGFGIGNPPKEFQLYRELEDMSEQAEVGRLFYVACTRAMDKLILTTTSKKPGGKKTTRNFTDILSSTMDLSSPPSDGFYHLAGVDVVVHTIGPEVTPVPTAEIVSTPKPGKFFLNRIPGYIGGEIYSATLLQTFRLCPTKYFLSYRLGMRGLERRLRPESNEDYTDAILSTAKGQLIHSILQIAVARSSTDQSSIRIFAENTVSAGVVSELTGQGRENLVRRITENAVAAIETLKSLARLDNAFPEQTVTRKIGDDFITGTLDLIVADDEGLHVFDYKTNRLDKGLDRIYSDYETQMKLYALLCSKLKAEQNEFDATIIFTREPNKYIRRVYAKSQLAEFEGELRSMIGQIKALETPDGRFPSEDLLPTVTQHCPECEYFAEHGCLMKREAIGTR